MLQNLKIKKRTLVYLLLTLIFFLFSFLLLGCANQLPPPGGDPDKIPPTIVEFYPPNGTTNYDDDYFEVTFSEYVDKRSATEAIFYVHSN